MRGSLRASTIAAVLKRGIRNPSLLPEIWRKAWARFTLEHHQARIAACADLALPPAEGIARLLTMSRETVRPRMEQESLQKLLFELEAVRPEAAGGAAFLQALFAIVDLTKPQVVLETGVCLGYSTTVILHALTGNPEARLYSVDLPSFQPGAEAHTGSIIPHRLRSTTQWELLLGPDRQHIPDLLKRIGLIDFFHYDSDKSYEGMRFTLSLVWRHLRPGAVLMMDDINSNDAFLEFADSLRVEPVVIAKPSAEGVYRWSKTYYVGLLRKGGSAT